VESLSSRFPMRIPFRGSEALLNSHGDPMRQAWQSHISEKGIVFVEV